MTDDSPERKLKMFERNMAFSLVPLYLNVFICLIDGARGELKYEWIPAIIGACAIWWLYRSFRNKLIIYEVKRRFRSA